MNGFKRLLKKLISRLNFISNYQALHTIKRNNKCFLIYRNIIYRRRKFTITTFDISVQMATAGS